MPLLLEKEKTYVAENETYMLDLRDKEKPLHVCICGSKLWNVQCMFEDGEISLYFLDMECALCGAKATAPTPVD